MIHEEEVSYPADVSLRGVLVYDRDVVGPRPGVLVAPDAMGVGDHAKQVARRLAALGYTALVADVYGDGRQLSEEELMPMVEMLSGDLDLYRGRSKAGLATLADRPEVDATRLAAIGYCLGGRTVLELARAGADVKGVVAFHGVLDTSRPEDAAQILGIVLACVGADDPMCPPEQRKAFEDEMRAAKVDWRMHLYGNAVHAFTLKGAEALGRPGVAYHEATDRRSWRDMLGLFEEIF